jgi:hypothetical protein
MAVRNPIYIVGPQSEYRNSFLFIAYEFIKDSSIVEQADSETFVITEGNMAQTAL